MITKVYLIDLESIDSADYELALKEITDRISCLIEEKLNDILELTITCRVYDLKFVEMMLAPFV